MYSATVSVLPVLQAAPQAVLLHTRKPKLGLLPCGSCTATEVDAVLQLPHSKAGDGLHSPTLTATRCRFLQPGQRTSTTPLVYDVLRCT